MNWILKCELNVNMWNCVSTYWLNWIIEFACTDFRKCRPMYDFVVFFFCCTRYNGSHYEHWMGIIFSLFLMVAHFPILKYLVIKLTICIRRRQCRHFMMVVECRFWHKCNRNEKKTVHFGLQKKRRTEGRWGVIQSEIKCTTKYIVSRSKWNKAHGNGRILWSRTTTYICFRLMIFRLQ